MRQATIILIAGLVCLWAEGCAFQEERALRQDLAEEARALRLEDLETDTDPKAPPLPANPGIQDYLAQAALGSPALRKAYYTWQAAVEKAPQARALPDPKFSYGHYIRSVETRVGPQENRFALMQMVPWPTKLANREDVAIRNGLAAKYMYDAEKLALFYRVRKAYAEYYYLARAITVVQDTLVLLKNLEESVRTRYKADAASAPALLQLQVELGKLEDREKSLRAFQAALSGRLSAAIGQVPKDPLPLPHILETSSPALEEEALLATLVQDNPGLQAARARIQAARAGERLARSQYFPDLDLGASFIETDRRPGMNLEDNGKDPVMVTLDISLPLWWSKYNAGVREARANRKAAEADLEDRRLQLASDVRMAFYNYEDAGRKENLFAKTLVPKAEQALAAARTAFAAGQSAFADVIDAERNLLELRLLAERAEVDRSIRLAELEMLSGRDLR